MTLKVDHYRASTVPSDEGDEGYGALSSLDGVAVVLRVRVVGAVVEVEDVDAVDAAVVHGVGALMNQLRPWTPMKVSQTPQAWRTIAPPIFSYTSSNFFSSQRAQQR